MDAPVDPKLLRSISTTKKLLGKHISKPVLADKYLGRPPFRFLLEIVNNVIQQTNFMKNVFSTKELNYDEISNAEDKRAVLKKVIEAIENETGEKCGARTSKILSGKEPEKTNEMLQSLARAISSYSNKSKEKDEETVKVSEKPDVSSPSATDSKVKESTTRNSNDKKGTRASNESDSKKQGQPLKSRVSSGAVPLSKKSSTTTSTVKQRPSGDKLNVSLSKKKSSSVMKNSGSSSTIKVPSKETLKTKSGSPSASSSSLVPSKKVSHSMLTRSQSRHSLPTKTSSTKVPAVPDSTKTPGKLQEETKKFEPKDKVQQMSEEPSKSAAMPPETTAEVPLQRPVTRTKYRQKTAENAEPNTDKEATEAATSVSQISDSEHHPVARNENTNASIQLVESDKKECNSCGVRSGRSSSSEDVVTEHMNERISQWRATSAEDQVQQESVAGATGNFKNAGWVTDEVNSGRPSTQMSRVFDSVENCTAEQDTILIQANKTVSVEFFKAPRVVEEKDKNPLKRPVTVLRDIESDDEDETFLVQEKLECERDMALERIQQGALLMNAAGRAGLQSFDITYLPPEHRGLLVNQIMETQRELEQLSGGNHNYHQRHSGSLLESELAERDKAAVREVYMKQIEDLKGAIQTMSKCANPLANIVQRSQDDACLMEIEFRKLRQENERLQRKIDEAKGETSRILHPLTEELAQLDSRIEKVEGAIVLAKQRLSLIDTEYTTEFIAQIESTPTEDETQAGLLETDPMWQFRGNNFDDDDGEGGTKRSLLDVFKRAVDMHEGAGSTGGCVVRDDRVRRGVTSPSTKVTVGTPKSERRLLNRTIYGVDSPLGRISNRIMRQLDEEKPPIDKENKPSWWD